MYDYDGSWNPDFPPVMQFVEFFYSTIYGNMISFIHV